MGFRFEPGERAIYVGPASTDEGFPVPFGKGDIVTVDKVYPAGSIIRFTGVGVVELIDTGYLVGDGGTGFVLAERDLKKIPPKNDWDAKEYWNKNIMPAVPAKSPEKVN